MGSACFSSTALQHFPTPVVPLLLSTIGISVCTAQSLFTQMAPPQALVVVVVQRLFPLRSGTVQVRMSPTPGPPHPLHPGGLAFAKFALLISDAVRKSSSCSC